MSNKGFAEIQTDIETPNGVNVTEKPLKTDKNRIKRVDINILKSKLQETESKECGIYLQKITKNLDQGQILYSKKFKIKNRKPTPQNYFNLYLSLIHI